MGKKAVAIIITLVIIAALGFVFLKPNSTSKPPIPVTNTEAIKKVDLSTQPEWVQKLTVTAKKGRSANGLDNFTLTVSGIDSSVDSLTYIAQYETSNKGTQGALAMSPQKVSGGKFTKTIDLGTCSTKSCVRHDGVTKVDLELDFSDSSVWTGSISL